VKNALAIYGLNLALVLPFGFIASEIALGHLGANPVERLLHLSGQAGLWLIFGLTCLPRLAILFNWDWLKTWSKKRRRIGLSLFFYACLHLGIFFLDQLTELEKLPKNLVRPFTLSGLVAWVIFLVLALTSSSWAQHKLKKNWNRLHRLVWLALPLIWVHLTLKEEGDPWRASFWLFPPIMLWLALRYKTRPAGDRAVVD